MNVSVRMAALIIGIGNPLRSDDGLGWAVAQRLACDTQESSAIYTVHQLTPELAQQMAQARLVVMIDASCEGEPGAVSVRALSAPALPGGAGTHQTTPEELVALTAAVYGSCPPVVLVTITGADFGIGEQLSSVVARKIAQVSAIVRQMCTAGLSDEQRDEPL